MKLNWLKQIIERIIQRSARPRPERVVVTVEDHDMDRLQLDKDLDTSSGRVELDRASDPDIDFTWMGDLEAYTESLSVPEEKIEQWISAGLLFPDEIRIAEKILKLLRDKKLSRGVERITD